MRQCFLITFFSLIATGMNAQNISSRNTLTESFAYRVHTIDLFFDRFNYNKNIDVIKYIQAKNPKIEFTRARFVRSLFNLDLLQQSVEKYNLASRFILNVTDSLTPQYLSYKDANWFTNVKCKLIYKGKPTFVDVVLKVEQTKNKGFKWSVISASGNLLNKSSVADSMAIIKDAVFQNTLRGNNFLTPVSHVLDFSGLFKFFENKEFVMDYVTQDSIPFELKKLIYFIRKKQVQFVSTYKIRYHLLQLPNWILEVNYFNRPNNNSGWLISRLTYGESEYKNRYIKSTLNLIISKTNLN